MNIVNWIEKNKKIIIIVLIVLLIICIITKCYKENFENSDSSATKVLCCPKGLPYFLATDGKGGKKKCMQYNDSRNLNVNWENNDGGNIELSTAVNDKNTCESNKNLIFAGGKCQLRQNAWNYPSKKDSCGTNQVEVQ